ncbi:hypothetical protein MUCCIDRAFT_115267 [Mucor lusitanicus CBS 277.49]|uniref:Uncharacterized protein n=1 Tax=Mucor lusitanicus CBS 277.49 TaxID=747725 RepID=A0A168H498_MUCCL|nr:hypothetical protein MUCCIDRAFT_115267 [Mucor lusitanicus CBS 277.49]
MSHHGNSEIAHAEAALQAGRPYEKSTEGHNQMFDNKSRGEQMDEQLAEEDRETIQRMEQAHKQREQAHQPKHKHE